jgi:DNA-binding transcriptional LysR family regulator
VALRDVTASFAPVSFWLIWREAAAQPPVHRRFVDELRSSATRAKA